MITVIKLGGSLLSTPVLPLCLDAIRCFSGQVLIVPGGGVFADQVRAAQVQWGFDEVTAHRMAILAMQQMALLLKSLQPEFELFNNPDRVKELSHPAIWSPNQFELDQAGIAASWDVTSDSLAAWLANRVTAEALFLVKSCQIPAEANFSELQQLGVIDAGFLQFTRNLPAKITIINKDHFLSLA
ncbi:MAG: uridylate kinase [Methylomonas sp.]|nr:MAG: uridylate kinase [Methylomonas sp.]